MKDTVDFSGILNSERKDGLKALLSDMVKILSAGFVAILPLLIKIPSHYHQVFYNCAWASASVTVAPVYLRYVEYLSYADLYFHIALIQFYFCCFRCHVNISFVNASSV